MAGSETGARDQWPPRAASRTSLHDQASGRTPGILPKCRKSVPVISKSVRLGPGRVFSLARSWQDIARALATAGLQHVQTTSGAAPRRCRRRRRRLRCRWHGSIERDSTRASCGHET
eukprot:scaffold83069_cov60-Phaeocystis_antarctica.AAC.2